MMTDKEIIINMVNRAIDNFTSGSAMSWFRGDIKDYIDKWLEPYIDGFTDENGTFETEIAAAYVQDKTENELKRFKEKYRKESKDDNHHGEK